MNIEEIYWEDDHLTSIPPDQRIEKELAKTVYCSICKGVPTRPVVTDCGHIFCKSCITMWLCNSNMCPSCLSAIEILNVRTMNVFTESVFGALNVKCIYESDGCSVISNIFSIRLHQKNCPFGKLKSVLTNKPVTRGRKSKSYASTKIPLIEANS